MRRRDLLKYLAASSLALGMGLGRRKAAAATYDRGPLYLYLYAGGGWDPTMLCDPKGSEINRAYEPGDIKTVGPFRFAPITGAEDFLREFGDDLLVINGIEMATGSHDGGTRYMASGHLEGADYPSFGAVAAGLLAPSVPLSHLTFGGGYNSTAGMVPLTRVRADLREMQKLSGGDYINGDRNQPYYPPAARARIDQSIAARHERDLAGQALPYVRTSMAQLEGARLSADDLRRLEAWLPTTLEGNGVERQVRLALAAFKAGICVSANLGFGNFDSHADNDASQAELMPMALGGVTLALREAERLGLRDRLVIVVASEFGRTPGYNNQNGKDHYPVNSMLVLGSSIRGGRVVGATDDEQKALALDPVTLEPSTAESAVKLTPEHLHLALRAHAGVIDDPALERFPLYGARLPLL